MSLNFEERDQLAERLSHRIRHDLNARHDDEGAMFGFGAVTCVAGFFTAIQLIGLCFGQGNGWVAGGGALITVVGAKITSVFNQKAHKHDASFWNGIDQRSEVIVSVYERNRYRHG